MRAAAAERLPELAHYYPGLLPWEIDRLTPAELELFLDNMDRW